MKYVVSFIAIIVSYIASNFNKNLFYLWIPLAIISGLYSYYWDLKYDWGLLEPQVK